MEFVKQYLSVRSQNLVTMANSDESGCIHKMTQHCGLGHAQNIRSEPMQSLENLISTRNADPVYYLRILKCFTR